MTKTNKEIAALNAEMDDVSICLACAKAKGGIAPDSPVSFWIGTCLACGKATDCTHVRDFRWPGGVRPTKVK